MLFTTRHGLLRRQRRTCSSIFLTKQMKTNPAFATGLWTRCCFLARNAMGVGSVALARRSGKFKER